MIGYLELLKNKAYMGYISLAGIAVAAVYIYAAKAPIVAANQIQLNPSEFGYYNLIPYLGYIISLYTSSRLSSRLSYKNIITFGLFMMSAGSLLILLASFLNHLNTYILFFGAFIIFCGSAPIVPNSMVLATKSIEDRSFAASFGSFFYMVLATFLTWLAGLPQITQSISYAIAIIFLVVLIFTINLYWVSSKKNYSFGIK
jgi:MFS family permease